MRRVHWKPSRVSSARSVPMRSAAWPGAVPAASTRSTSAGTMSPGTIGRCQRSWRKAAEWRVALRDVDLRAAEAGAPLVDPAQADVEGAGGDALEPVVERRAHGEAALVQLLRAVVALEVLADFLEVVRRERGLAGRIAAGDDRPRLGLGGGLGGEEAFVGHPIERVVAPAERCRRVDVGALPGVALQDAGDHRRLFDRQVLDRLAEVQLRRRLDAVGAVAEVHLVAVEREDLLLGVALLDLHRQQQLLDLALPGLLVGEEQLAGELLGQRAGAAGLAHLDQVGDDGAGQPGEAQAEVLEEAGVLGGQDGLAHLQRDVVVAQDHATLDRELADHGRRRGRARG